MSTYNTLERRRGFQADAAQEDLRKDLSMYALQQQSGYGVWDGSPNDRNGNQAGYYSGPLASVTTSSAASLFCPIIMSCNEGSR